MTRHPLRKPIICDALKSPQWHVLKINLALECDRLSEQHMKPSREQDVVLMRYLTSHIKAIRADLKFINEKSGLFN